MEMPQKRIPVSGPSVTEREIRYVTEAVTGAWYESANQFHDRFERAFAEYLQVKWAIALPSCTSAIHLALMALGVGPGDEVIVPDCTWIASAAPISYVGATPVFADVDPVTWCLTASSMEACITPRTKAVIPVDLYGSMPDMDEITRIAAKHRIAIIEDAAEAVGSEYHGRKAGSFGSAGVFSFHGSKTLTTGEGGLLATNSEELRQKVLFLRDHGRPPGDRLFQNTAVAWKYKMSSMQAALGLAQLERVDELVALKRRVFGWYREELGSIQGISLNAEPEGTFNSYWMSTLLLDRADSRGKESLMNWLWSNNIDCRPFFHPLSSLKAYQNHPEAATAAKRNIVAYDLSRRGVNLPSALNLTREQVATVASSIKQFLKSSTQGT